MCGIFLYIGKPRDVTKMKRDFDTCKHRGPDNTIFTVRYITIDEEEIMIVNGFHRLCINGLKPEAD